MYVASQGFVFDVRVAVGQVEAYYAFPGTSHWVTKLHVTSYAPSFGPGVIYLPCTDGLYALDITNGHILWHNPNVHGTPSYGYGKVYVTDEHTLWALSASTGALAWHYTVTSSFYSTQSATVTSSAVYLQPVNGHRYAFNPANGTVLWNVYSAGFEPMPGTPIEYEGYLFSVEDDGQITARLASDGSFLWAAPFLYVSSVDGNGMSLLPANTSVF